MSSSSLLLDIIRCLPRQLPSLRSASGGVYGTIHQSSNSYSTTNSSNLTLLLQLLPSNSIFDKVVVAVGGVGAGGLVENATINGKQQHQQPL
eukprot:scaffold39402_cov305-Skeletonema_dohrnii-CCMP3373.AAC.1